MTSTAQPVGALTERNTQDWLHYFNRSSSGENVAAPDIRILALPELLKKIRKPNTIGSGSQVSGIDISDQELDWLKRFHDEIRNQFIHFSPMGWSIELSGVPDICAMIAKIIGAVHLSGWGFRNLEQTDQMTLKRDIERLSQVQKSAI